MTAAAVADARLGWDFSCPDWAERLRAGKSLMPPLPIDRKKAGHAVAIFNRLRLPDVAGQPRLAEAAGDWQREIPAAVFGSLQPDGRRMVRKVFQLVPKKNNKTTGGAAIMLTALLVDKTPRQPYFLYGPSQEIAQGAFDQAVGMIVADPVLKARFQIRAHIKTILDLKTDSTLKIQTFDEGVATGVKPKGALVDEVHILGKRHYAERVMGQLWGGMVSRPDSFLIEITTQSDQEPAGLFAAELKLARGIRDGRITGEAANTLPLLYEFPEEFQRAKDEDGRPLWANPECWWQVLPNLGRSVHLDLLRQLWAEAHEKGEEEERRWASQHLNIQIGIGLHHDRWAGADYWEQAAFEPLRDLDVLLDRSEVVTVGVDGGGFDDLTGIAVCGRDAKTGIWLFWNHAWAHRIVLERRKDIASRLMDFAEDGDLTFWGDPKNPPRAADLLSDDENVRAEAMARRLGDEDIQGVAEICERVRDSGLLPELEGIGVDRAAIGAVLKSLELRGFSMSNTEAAGQVTAIIQGAASMHTPIVALQRKLEGAGAAHGGTRMMAWCVGNAKAVRTGNAIRIDKQVSGQAKIDPLIATFNATKLMDANPEPGGAISPYAERGLIAV